MSDAIFWDATEMAQGMAAQCSASNAHEISYYVHVSTKSGKRVHI